MTVASGARGVVASFGFLVATALEDGAVQIEAEAFRWHGPRECEKPFPKRTPELFDVALTEANEQIAHGVGAGEALDAQAERGEPCLLEANRCGRGGGLLPLPIS